jgi:hypothetical protein
MINFIRGFVIQGLVATILIVKAEPISKTLAEFT